MIIIGQRDNWYKPTVWKIADILHLPRVGTRCHIINYLANYLWNYAIIVH